MVTQATPIAPPIWHPHTHPKISSWVCQLLLSLAEWLVCVLPCWRIAVIPWPVSMTWILRWGSMIILSSLIYNVYILNNWCNVIYTQGIERTLLENVNSELRCVACYQSGQCYCRCGVTISSQLWTTSHICKLKGILPAIPILQLITTDGWWQVKDRIRHISIWTHDSVTLCSLLWRILHP